MALRDILVKFGIEVDQQPIVDAQRGVNNLVVRLNQLQRIAGFAFAAMGAGALTDSYDELVNLQNRLKAVTGSTQEFEAAQQGVVDVARKAFTPIEDVAALFQRYTQVTDGLGVSQEEVLDFTHRLIQAGKLSGAGVAELRGSLIQLGQGIGNNFKSGGQELTSILEQTPEIAKIIAAHLGVDKRQLKAAAKAGKITAEAVFEAFRSRGAELDKRFAKRKLSFEDVKVRAGIEWMVLMEKLAPAISKVIDKLLEFVNEMQHWVESGAAVNDVIAGLITVVGVLSVVFAGLAVQVLKTALPLIALFLLVEDFVTFMRGGDSLIGRAFEKMFGPKGAENAREVIGELWEFLKGFFKWITSLDGIGSTFKIFYDAVVEWGGKAFNWLTERMHAFVDTMTSAIRAGLGGKLSDLLDIPKDGQRELDRAYAERDAKEHDQVGNALSGAAIANPDITVSQRRAEEAARTPLSQKLWDTFSRPEVKGLGYDPMMNPAPTVSQLGVGRKVGGDVAPAAQINNTITVQGNATPAVAREIAQRTGEATSASLGRDRAAIGASVGAP